MSDILNIGISALRASQQQLGTTGHNIANVNTDGYSRQRVEQVTRPPQFSSGGYVGKGVSVNTIERVANEFLTTQLRSATTNEAGASTFLRLAAPVDTLLGDGTFTQALEGFANSVQDANDDPGSIPARAVMLDSAKSLVARIADLDDNLAAISRNVNDEIVDAVGEINSLATAIADLNDDIVRALGTPQGQPPNDLLDQRDTLIRRLSAVTGVTTTEQANGAVNVFIGNGQTVVQGSGAITLSTAPNALDPTQLEIAYNVNGIVSPITNVLKSGELGAVLEFRDDLIEPTRNAIGRIATTLAVTFNAQHRAGFDLNAAFGGDFFAVGSPQANAAAGNVGTIAVTINNPDINNLTTADYRLTHDGSDFVLTNLQDNTSQTLSGAGPFNVDGFTITVTGAPAAGDSYLVQPTKPAARTMTVLLSDPEEIALALPIHGEAQLSNLSDASIAVDQILDVTDPQLLNPTQFVFNDPPTTYQINGAGPLIPYTSGADIDINGYRVQISGAPEPGDTFSVSANVGGTGDNRNGLLLAGLAQEKFIDGGTATYQDAYGQLVSTVGSKTQQTRISSDALSILRENAEAERNSVSAVNLDEEAANLLRFQQSYQAAAQLISTGNDLFQSLLAAFRR